MEDMIGYVQLYFRVVGRDETYYAAFDGDFGVPLTGRRLRYMKKSIKAVYNKFDKVSSISFCSKEEYDSYMQEENHQIWRYPHGIC